MGARNEQRWLRLREELWPLNLLAGVLGIVVSLVALEATEHQILGRAWITDAAGARTAIAAVFGVQATVLSVGLSLTMLMLQNAAGQYSPRLVELFVREPQIRWVIPLFVFSGAFDLVSVWILGLGRQHEQAPQPAVAVAYLLLFLVAGLLVFLILRTIRAIRVEVIFERVVQRAEEAARRLAAWKATLPLAAEDSLLEPPAGSQVVYASASGYVIDVAPTLLLRLAEERDLRIGLERGIGAWVDRGERVGWFVGDQADGNADPALGWRVAEGLVSRSERSVHYDIGFLLQILTEVGVKALSPGVNDPQTARMALQQSRRILRLLCRVGKGWVLHDRSGHPRVSLSMTDSADQLSMAVEGIVRYGARDPDVLMEAVALLRDVGTRESTLRESASIALARVREDASLNLDQGRATRVLQAIERADAAIRGGLDQPEPSGDFLYALVPDSQPHRE